MKFNPHYELTDRHAFLSASNYHWLNYDEEKLRDAYAKSQAQYRGTALHDFASQAILLGIKLPKTKSPVNQFVNDAIGYRMAPEQILFYSYNAFGTCDAISFRSNLLRVHDLKTGLSRVSMEQLEVYSALFCLEYDQLPKNIDIELRIYQSTKIILHEPAHVDIRRIMEKIIYFDKKIEEFKSEEHNPWQK
jgi:hypothetical protein